MSRHAYWISVLLFSVLIIAKFDPKTGFTSLIHFGETWHNRRLNVLQDLPIATQSNSNGYDGQFYSQLALDPLLRNPELAQAIDAPVYRARRILTSAAAALAGLGSPWWTLQAYALLNVACWGILSWLLFKNTRTESWTGFGRWAGCMFSMGVLDSVRQSLVDLPALLLLALATHSWEQSRPNKSTLWLALGNLAKETNLLGTLALHSDPGSRKVYLKRRLVMLALAMVPISAWSLYVQQRLGGTSTDPSLGNFTWPFFGLFAQAKLCLTEILNGNFDGRYSFGFLAIIGLLIQLIFIWRAPQPESRWWRVGAAYSLLLPFLGLWVWSGYWAACRAVLPMTIVFNLLLPANRFFWPLWSFGNLTLLHAVWRFL